MYFVTELLRPQLRTIRAARSIGAAGATPQKLVLGLIVAATIIRTAFASVMGLGIDESYTVATSRHLDLAYFDHPPMAWWLSWAATHFAGTDSALAVRIPFLVLFALSTWLMYRLTAALFDEESGLWAAVTLNLAPVFGVTTGSWVLPDGPLTAAMLACAVCLARVLFVPNTRPAGYWIAAGMLAGLALLSKLHGAFLISGVALFLTTNSNSRRWLAQPWPYLAAATALLVFAPVLIWNANHDWVSFVYQGGRATLTGLRPWGPLIAVAGQSLFIAPWIWVPLVASWIATIRADRSDPKVWFLSCLAVGPIAVFTLVPLWTSGPIMFHWAAPGYLMLFPFLGAAVSRRLPQHARSVQTWLTLAATALCAILLLVGTELRFDWLGSLFPQRLNLQSSLMDGSDWSNLRAALGKQGLLAAPNVFVTGTKWNVTGKADYAVGGLIPALCLCAEPKQYGVVHPYQRYAGWDGVIVAPGLTRSRVDELYGSSFDDIEDLGPLVLTQYGHVIGTVSIFVGHKFKPPPTRPPWAS